MNELETEKEKTAKLQSQLIEMERRVKILIRQCDEWAKSYDKLLKDFISFRERKDR